VKRIEHGFGGHFPEVLTMLAGLAFDRGDCERFGVFDHLESLVHNGSNCCRDRDERTDVCQYAFVVQRHRKLGPQISQHAVYHVSQNGWTIVFAAVSIELPTLVECVVAIDKL